MSTSRNEKGLSLETKNTPQETQTSQVPAETLPSAIRILRHQIAHELDKLERMVNISSENPKDS